MEFIWDMLQHPYTALFILGVVLIIIGSRDTNNPGGCFLIVIGTVILILTAGTALVGLLVAAFAMVFRNLSIFGGGERQMAMLCVVLLLFSAMSIAGVASLRNRH